MPTTHPLTDACYFDCDADDDTACPLDGDGGTTEPTPEERYAAWRIVNMPPLGNVNR